MSEERLIEFDLSTASEDVIRILLEDVTDSSIFSEVIQSNMHRPNVLRMVYEHPNTPPDINRKAADSLGFPLKSYDLEKVTEEPVLEKKENILQRIQKLTVGEKLHLALRGGKEIRAVLLRDPNKEVVLKVLENQRLTDGEVEMIARNPAFPVEVLRTIAKNREWIKKYSILLPLVSNPKTPAGISISLISHVRLNDLLFLEKNRNIPNALREAVRRYIKIKRQA